MNINPLYTNKNTQKEIKKFYEQNGFIQLENFIEGDIPNLENLKFEKVYNPIYISKKINKDFKLEIENFENFIKEITNSNQINLTLNQYEHKDFIILNDKTPKDDTIDIILDFTSNWKKEFGGILTYTTKDTEIFYLEPKYNTLTIVNKPKEVMKYLKYINNKANNTKILRFEN